MYSDADVAALYDTVNPWGAQNELCLALVLRAESVLDVGCGTGRLLHRARDAGHAGRLCGVDPDPAMLAVAARREDIEWVRATAAEIAFEREFDLAVMTGHAFQMLVGDDEIDASLRAIGRALTDDGRFAFETRNLGGREWERWTPANRVDVVDPAGRRVVVWWAVERFVDGVATVTETTADADGAVLRVDRGGLRFVDAETLDSFLGRAGFVVESRYGGWDREPFADSSREIVTIARRVRSGRL